MIYADTYKLERRRSLVAMRWQVDHSFVRTLSISVHINNYLNQLAVLHQARLIQLLQSLCNPDPVSRIINVGLSLQLHPIYKYDSVYYAQTKIFLSYEPEAKSPFPDDDGTRTLKEFSESCRR